MSRTMVNRRMGRIPVLLLLLAVILIFALFLKDILIPFITLEVKNDVDGATELLRQKGVLGFLAVILVEALQMVVIFIPAEFIQISSGLSYPFPIAIALCDLGVCLGATIIFILVRILHVRNEAFEKRRKTIDRLSENIKDRTTVFFLYLLFFMPMIPFGAICYYGSSTNLRYRKYLFTVATGVIPSIVVSNLMGAAGKAFIVYDLPFWLLVLIIVLLALLLIGIIMFFIKRFVFRDKHGTPDSMAYYLLFAITNLWHGRKQKATIHDELMAGIEPPYIVLCNHESFFDFHYISQMNHPKNPAYMVNELYCTRPILKSLSKAAGMIPKKLFVREVSSALAVFRTIRKGYPVVIFPEGRLSADGRTNPIIKGGAFYRKLNASLVLVQISGAYLSNPKWRPKRFMSDIDVTVKRVLTTDDIKTMTDSELDDLISETLANNAFRNEPSIQFRQKTKAKGLEGLLYRCADCGSLYTTVGKGNKLTCTSCGSEYILDDRYRFQGRIQTIPEYYDEIKRLEESTLDSFSLKANVKTKIHGANGGPIRWEKGVCTLTPEGFSYKSQSMDFSINMEDLPALAFSCSQEFELYHNEELMYFYPTEHRQQVARWALLVDMLAERRRS